MTLVCARCFRGIGETAANDGDCAQVSEAFLSAFNLLDGNVRPEEERECAHAMT